MSSWFPTNYCLIPFLPIPMSYLQLSRTLFICCIFPFFLFGCPHSTFQLFPLIIHTNIFLQQRYFLTMNYYAYTLPGSLCLTRRRHWSLCVFITQGGNFITIYCLARKKNAWRVDRQVSLTWDPFTLICLTVLLQSDWTSSKSMIHLFCGSLCPFSCSNSFTILCRWHALFSSCNALE